MQLHKFYEYANVYVNECVMTLALNFALTSEQTASTFACVI